MLKSIHKTATALFTKALVGLLILSFAALGIAEIFTSTDNPTIASMGDQRISTHDFKRRYQEQLDLIAAQYGQHLTPQQARAIGVENSVLLAMLNELASNAYAQDLKLHITDNAVVENIRRDTLFAGVDGQFSPQLLIQARNRLGISELEFITMRRANIIRDHIINSLLEATTVPPTLYNAYQIFNHEQRKARYFVVDTKHFNVPPSMPDEKVLRDTYSANKSLFMTDELRDVEILMLTLSDVKRKLKISKNQLRKRYYRDIKNYTIPETRRVLQIPFRSVRAARKASNDIINGKHFDIVAKENEANEEDIDLGKISKDKLIDPIIAEAAFTLKKGEISKAIEGRFTVALLKVTDISPSKVIQFKDVQKQIRDNMINNMAPYEMRKLLDSIDDNRLAGKSFKEIAKLLGITFHEVKSINRSGYDTNDKLVISSPDLNKIMLSAFESAINIENDFIKLSDGGYAWTKTSSIIKEMQKPFEQVQDEVKKIWLEKQERKALSRLTAEYIRQLNNGSSFEEIAEMAGKKIKLTSAFKRNDKLPNISSVAIEQAFNLEVGSFSVAPTKNGMSRMIFEVVEIIPPSKTSDEEKKQLEQRLLQNLRANTVKQLMLYLRNRYGATTDQRLIDQTVGISKG